MTNATWTHLLPPAVAVVDGAVTDATERLLLPEERAAIATAVAKRRREFASVRACARRAMERLGCPPMPLLHGSHREPLWPPGIVGSLAHVDDWCAAAVARAEEVAAVGIDLEHDEALEPSLWNRVTTESERQWLLRQAEARRGALAKLLFSAKETLYKCQFPTTRQFLAFADVEVAVDLDHGSFTATLRRPAGRLAAGESFTGRFASDGGLWITAMAWLRGGASHST